MRCRTVIMPGLPEWNHNLCFLCSVAAVSEKEVHDLLEVVYMPQVGDTKSWLFRLRSSPNSAMMKSQGEVSASSAAPSATLCFPWV